MNSAPSRDCKEVAECVARLPVAFLQKYLVAEHQDFGKLELHC